MNHCCFCLFRPQILQDPLVDEARITGHVQLLRSLKAGLTCDIPEAMGRAYPIVKFIDALHASWMLRSSSNMQNVARRVVSFLLPPILLPAMLKRIDSSKGLVIPERTTVMRGRIAFDLGFAVSMREILTPEGLPSPPWWLWADSSPIAGTNWQLCHMHYCLCKTEQDWQSFAGAFHELCSRNSRGYKGVLQDDSEIESDEVASDVEDFQLPSDLAAPTQSLRPDDGEWDIESWDSDHDIDDVSPPEPQASQKSTKELTRILCKSLGYHTPLPQALGSRAANLPNKVSSVLGSFVFETDKQAGMAKFLDAGVAGTFDLGVEFGIGEVNKANYWSHFSSHVRPSKLKVDDGENDADFSSDEPSDPSHDTFLFKKMLSIAALLHIIDGVDKDLHEGIKGFDDCMKNMSALTGLLCNEGPRQAFLARVVNGGGLPAPQSSFRADIRIAFRTPMDVCVRYDPLVASFT